MHIKPVVWLMPMALIPRSGIVWADFTLNMPRGVTPISHTIYDLHILILGMCAVIAALLYGFMFYSIFAHRKSKGAVAVQFHKNTLVEVLWTIVPFLILVLMAVPATKATIAMHDTSEAEVTIRVTGYQGKWRYEYLEDGIKFVSNLQNPGEQMYKGEAKGERYLQEVDNPLVLPVGKKVRFLITAAEVAHACWVPDFGRKQDATPRFINEGWVRIEKPGTYRGKCAEPCGRGHACMPIVVEAKSEQAYRQWISGQKALLAAAQDAVDKTFTKDEIAADPATL